MQPADGHACRRECACIGLKHRVALDWTGRDEVPGSRGVIGQPHCGQVASLQPVGARIVAWSGPHESDLVEIDISGHQAVTQVSQVKLETNSGRADTCRSAQQQNVPVESLLNQINEHDLSEHMYTANLPDPDLVIRTSGEMRISNFLLWQIAYAEIFVTDRLWPDFRGIHLLEAITDFQRRERRYGGIGQAVTDEVLPEELPELLRH